MPIVAAYTLIEGFSKIRQKQMLIRKTTIITSIREKQKLNFFSYCKCKTRKKKQNETKQNKKKHY